jgi:histidinol-phosphate aminotransferase
MVIDVDNLVRKCIRDLKPYSSARSEFKGEAEIFLDANENSFGSPVEGSWHLNRYPDPLQLRLKEKIQSIKNITPDQMLLGNGSDECIDLLVRCFCEPGKDSIMIFPPTYGMYKVVGGINNIGVVEVPLLPNFQLDLDATVQSIDETVKMLFLCSPNNPTGNNFVREDIEAILNNFDGIVVIDEAYINYSRHKSFLPELADYPNLVVLHTFSKAWGLAGIRLGMLFASPAIIGYLNKIKPPYNIGSHTAFIATNAIAQLELINSQIRKTVSERERISDELRSLSFVEAVYTSDANFILVKFRNGTDVFNKMKDAGIILRDRSKEVLLENCVRLTIGTPEENERLIDELKKLS